MANSGQNINYNLRPCKSVERKMICELIKRLSPLGKPEEYRYIGMGAKYFTDFALIHRDLGIKEMHSMEINTDENNKKRFEFNKPFNCINLLFGEAGNLLNSTKMNWKNEKNIIWLDYDGGFHNKQLRDIETCMRKAEGSSIVFVTFNADFGESFRKAGPNEKLELFCEKVDNANLTGMLGKKSVAGEEKYLTLNKMFNMVVRSRVSERNRIAQGEKEKIQCEQIAYFRYADSKAEMLTIGWCIYNKIDQSVYDNCGVNELEFYNNSAKPYEINVPNLTYKEISILNQNMPNADHPIEGAEFITEIEIEEYKKIYKYYPTMFEVPISL